MPTSRPRRQSFRLVLTMALMLSLTAGAWPGPRPTTGPAAGAPAETPAQTNAETEERAREAYGKLGVSFEENRGQADGRVRFLARHGGATVFLTNEEAAFVLSAPAEKRAGAGEEPFAAREGARLGSVSMKFEGANPAAEVVGERELEGKVNYISGSDPSEWRTNVKTYGAVRYRGIYDGVDLVYYGNERREMEYDFQVSPGADPRQISLRIEGAEDLKVDASGALVINTAAGEMRQRKPVVYQEAGGARREVEGAYDVQPGGSVRFALGEYDEGRPLVIDPVLEYSTYLGGSDSDSASSIAVDSAGNAYVTGGTWSKDFPTKDPIQSYNVGGPTDAYVTKFNADGSDLVYSTYIGGSSWDAGFSIAVDPSGNAYVTGYTQSTDFPRVNAVQAAHGGGRLDAFVLKINAAGSALVYSTYLGGSGGEQAYSVAADSSGNAYVVGYTGSTDFSTANAVQAVYGGGSVDAFVTKLDAAGSAFVYSTYLGGSANETGYGVAVDSAGNAYVAGNTASPEFPTVNPIQSELRGGGFVNDAFVTKFNAAGSALVYSTYLGGSSDDGGKGIAVDSSGNAYVTGTTQSADFPTANAVRRNKADSVDAFVTKINAAGSALVYSTFLGGSRADQGIAIAVDPSGNAYVAGQTNSNDFPTTNAIQSKNQPYQEDAFVAKLNAAGSAFNYSTYLGGGSEDYAQGIAADSEGSAYVAGVARSFDFPLANAFQSSPGYTQNGFVTKIAGRSIRGRVVTNGAAGVVGVPWVTVKLTGAQTMTRLTDARGFYTFPDLVPGGDYTVTPSKTNLSFVPRSRDIADLTADLSGVNFTVPSLSVGAAAATERNWYAATATFTVTLKPASEEPVTVQYRTADGPVNSATPGEDYTALAGATLTFEPGETTKTVTVRVRGDTLDEPNETFRLLLSAPANALISDSVGVCTITDDD